MREASNKPVYKIVTGNPERKRPLETFWQRPDINIKIDSRNDRIERCGLDSSGSG
jgi:hypothetical protein